jgi:hypothetical protein
MRISSDLINRATVFINPLGNKEIDLRGKKKKLYKKKRKEE